MQRHLHGTRAAFVGTNELVLLELHAAAAALTDGRWTLGWTGCEEWADRGADGQGGWGNTETEQTGLGTDERTERAGGRRGAATGSFLHGRNRRTRQG